MPPVAALPATPIVVVAALPATFTGTVISEQELRFIVRIVDNSRNSVFFVMIISL